MSNSNNPVNDRGEGEGLEKPRRNLRSNFIPNQVFIDEGLSQEHIQKLGRRYYNVT